MKRHTAIAGLLAAAVALLAASCGGGGSDNGNGKVGVGGAQNITVNWGTEPPSLDPGLATDLTSANILQNIMDPLIRLDAQLQPTPGLARSWDISKDGKTITFHLRSDGRWTNGDPVTAQDFVFSWKRTLSPGLGADYAYQFYGIVGAQDYNTCKSACGAKAAAMGVKALDPHTLQVKLTSRQPWFMQQVAHTSFLPVNPKAVKRWGNKWTEASHIVTDGPFKLASWRHDARIDLVKWNGWRDASTVKLQRVNGKMLSDGTTAVSAFEADDTEVDMAGPPPADTSRWKGKPEFQVFPALGTYYYGFNTKKITDVNQRRAMAMAIDRGSIVTNITQASQLPAHAYVPKGMPGFSTMDVESQWLPPQGNLAGAKRLLAKVDDPVRDITLYYNNAPGHKQIATAVQAMWKQLGLNVKLQQQEFKQYLQFLGPPPNADVDVYRLGWIADFPDAMNFLEQWTCKSGNNNSNFCDPRYDALVEKARTTPDNSARYQLYGKLQELLFGANGQVPFTPLYWYTFPTLIKPELKDTYKLSPLGLVDLTKVKLAS